MTTQEQLHTLSRLTNLGQSSLDMDESVAVDALLKERIALRSVLIAIGNSCGSLLAEGVSTGFLVENVPGEVNYILSQPRPAPSTAYAEGYHKGKETGLLIAAAHLNHVANLSRTVLETDCFQEARLLDIRADEIRGLIPAETKAQKPVDEVARGFADEMIANLRHNVPINQERQKKQLLSRLAGAHSSTWGTEK